MRLDRFLSGQTAYSRKEVTAYIRSGSVTVNGVLVRKPDTAVNPETDAVALRGETVRYQTNRYFLMHKPEGVITATRDGRQETVLDLLDPKDRLSGIFPAGRLDVDTAGLLILTDDGDFAHRMLSPKSHAPKYYLVQLRDRVSQGCIDAFRSGISLREGDGAVRCMPAACAEIAPGLAVLELCEGKYHQVKRMFAAAGNHVEKLLRIQIGRLRLPPDLSAGGYLPILYKDIESALRKSDISDVCAFAAANYSSYWIK